jgi:hypothetical protein
LPYACHLSYVVHHVYHVCPAARMPGDS